MQRLVMALIAAVALIGVGWTALSLPVGAQEAGEKTLVSGWYKDRAVEYYDFGTETNLASGNSVQTAPIYVFIHGMNADGSPDFVEGQHNIVDVIPGDDGYSDLWQVMLVTVPEDYEPDSVTSKEELDAAGFEITATDIFVNCPIVPEGTTLEGGEPLTQGWYRGEEVFYPDFGENSPSAIPIWVFIHGMNADGTPDFVEGQQNIIDSVPGDPGYSAFWRVNLVTVPADYDPNSIRSADDVIAAGFPISQTDMVVNCPVTDVAAAPSDTAPGASSTPGAGSPPSGTTAPDTGTGDATGGATNTALIIGALALLVLGATGAGAAVIVRRSR